LQKRLDSWKISKTSNRWYRCFSSIPVFPAGCGEALPEGIDAAMHHNEAGGISGHVYCLVCWKRISAEIKTKLEEFEVKS